MDQQRAMPEVVLDDRSCISCGYNLRGLPCAGVCSECGASVSESLRDDLLQNASREYLTELLLGHRVVLITILVSIIVAVLAAIATYALGGSPGVVLALNFISIAISIVSIVGYFKIAAPNPRHIAGESPKSARQIVRYACIVSLVIACVSFPLQFFSPAGSFDLITILNVLVGLVSLVAWGMLFFGMMNHEQWLAKRVPDDWMVRRSGRYMWLLPVLYIVGALVLVGPLIALVLYWNFLDRMRKHLKSILETGAPADVKGRVGPPAIPTSTPTSTASPPVAG